MWLVDGASMMRHKWLTHSEAHNKLHLLPPTTNFHVSSFVLVQLCARLCPPQRISTKVFFSPCTPVKRLLLSSNLRDDLFFAVPQLHTISSLLHAHICTSRPDHTGLISSSRHLLS